ncbi:hypothetical protein [Couchioplanes caeruleus]|uniref:hypothetical protein n=1 Tax=Couchioplanes caeruleus TaxID=56438 RepID=UPI00116050E6|nr:hypothetical protein [Couchioplanes caeruleus]
MIALLEPILEALRNRLLEAPDDDAESAAHTLLTASSTLAWALAARRRPAEALEEAKSVRLHFRRALRDSARGRRALTLERSRYAVSRGLQPSRDARLGVVHGVVGSGHDRAGRCGADRDRAGRAGRRAGHHLIAGELTEPVQVVRTRELALPRCA